eukprot:1337165-Prorocentrum_lima.AAC.1
MLHAKLSLPTGRNYSRCASWGNLPGPPGHGVPGPPGHSKRHHHSATTAHRSLAGLSGWATDTATQLCG